MVKINKVLKILTKWGMVFVVMGVLANVTGNTVFCADIIVNSATKINLPLAGAAGRLYRVTDDVRGLWMDQGSQWFSLSGEVVNAKEFGAKFDGTTDDTTAIQNAYNVLSSGGILRLPGGTTLVSSPITLNKDGVYIVGAGRVATIIKYTGTGQVFLGTRLG